jgi:asparagine synthase (glutamine-hydrolysing)
MCGITGFWQLESLSSYLKLDESIKKMANTLSHRGPDDFGIWVDYNLKIAVGI